MCDTSTYRADNLLTRANQSSLMMRGYIYSFPDHLLLVERASDSTISDLESNEPWIPFWYCGLDQVSSWLDRSGKAA